jgi:uncharacterized protein (DUF779 family)
MKLLGNPISKPFKGILVFGFTLAIGATPLFAQTNSTLAALANGGSLTIDDKTFYGFSYQFSGLTAFDPSQIFVTASQVGEVDYLTWTGNMSLISGGFATADLVLNYNVTANPGLIYMIDQRYIGTAQNGSLLINETATSAGAPTAHSQLSAGFVSDPSDPNTYPNGPFDIGENDLLSISPAQSTLYVTKDIVLDVFSGGGSMTIDLVEQSFHQVPEPGTMVLGCLGGGLLLILRSRNQRRRA